MLNQNENVIQCQPLCDSVKQQKYFAHENNRQIEMIENGSSEKLNAALHKVKIELISKKRNILIEKIKKVIIEQIYYSEKQTKMNLSCYLSEKLGYQYTYMANMFAKVHGSSIQTFVIVTKVDRVKELMIYDDLTLTEISYKLHYSSVSHLSNQFKKITGLSPSQYLASITESEPIKSENMASISLSNSHHVQNIPVSSSKLNPITPKSNLMIYQQI